MKNTKKNSKNAIALTEMIKGMKVKDFERREKSNGKVAVYVRYEPIETVITTTVNEE